MAGTPEGLLAAINKSLEPATTPAPSTEVEDEDLDTGEVDETGDEAAQPSAAAGDGETGDADGTPGADGDGSAADGEPGGAAAGAPAAGKDGKPAAAASKPAGEAGGPDGKPGTAVVVPPVAAAPKDPINDPIPAGLKEPTRVRMVALVDTAKSLTTELTQVKSEFGEMMEHIRSTGATPTQYSGVLDYLAMVNSGDPVQLDKAIEIMQGELNALARLRGKPVAGVDLLAEHADLQEQVAAGGISQQHAEEMAALREQQKAQSRQRTTQQQTSQQQQQYRTEETEARATLTALGNTLKTDPHYAVKAPQALALVQAQMGKLRPSQWPGAFIQAYNSIANPVAAVVPKPKPAAAPATGVPANQPLRARNPVASGAPAKKVGTLLDAINAGIARASGK